MKKIFVFALSMAMAASVAVAQNDNSVKKPGQEKNTTSGAYIKFDEEKFDFGDIYQGDVVKHTFKFKNTGNAPLIISNVSTTCGCTVPTWPKDPIAPGKSASITAEFNSTGKMGMQHKAITIQSNATNNNAQVAIITNIKEKPAAGSSSTTPSAVNAAAAAKTAPAAPAATAGKEKSKKAKKEKN